MTMNETIPVKEVKEFLIEQKMKLLEYEKHSRGTAKLSMTGQIQVLDTFLVWLNTYIHQREGELNMEKLKLSLDTQAKSLDALQPRQRTSALTDAVLELAESLAPNTYKPINNPNIKSMRAVASKIWALRAKGKLPKDIRAIVRGKDLYLARIKESK